MQSSGEVHFDRWGDSAAAAAASGSVTDGLHGGKEVKVEITLEEQLQK